MLGSVEKLVAVSVERRMNLLLRGRNRRHGAQQEHTEEEHPRGASHWKLSRLALTAADELHDFVPVAGRDQRFGPLGARQNFEVALDGHAAAVQAEFTQQIGNARAGFCAAIFAIH